MPLTEREAADVAKLLNRWEKGGATRNAGAGFVLLAVLVLGQGCWLYQSFSSTFGPVIPKQSRAPASQPDRPATETQLMLVLDIIDSSHEGAVVHSSGNALSVAGASFFCAMGLCLAAAGIGMIVSAKRDRLLAKAIRACMERNGGNAPPS